MMRGTCKNCGHNQFTRDITSASADLSCSRCGAVQEENPIVSEVTFGETSGGAAVVQGSFIGADQARANFGGRGNALESREQTLSNGRRRIRSVAIALKIPDFISDAAFQWFKLALTNNFVQGRRSQNVVAACLYVACRKEKTHHMLIDFSSRLQISVYSVGATFLKMVKALHITSLPLADPSLFIQHFAEKLDFGKSNNKVVRDAVKLAQKMSDDWIHEGRKPAGVAGACLLLAARMNNFRRTHAEIVAVAHVGEETLQKRLNEFKQTGAAQLSVKEFREGRSTQSHNPPAFLKNRKEEEKLKMKLSEAEETSEEALRKNPMLEAILSECSLSEKEITEQIKRVTKQQKALLQSRLTEPPSIADESPEDDEEEEKDVPDLNEPKNLVKNLPKTTDLLAKISSDPENFDDISDDELDVFLLTKEESEMKERLWTGLNQDYLKDQERKRLKLEADQLAGHNSITKKRRKKAKDIDSENAESFASDLGIARAVNSIGEDGESLSAADSARIMLQKKAFSKKINYAVFDNLFKDSE